MISDREQKTLHEEDGSVTSILLSTEVEVGPRVKSIAEASAYRTESFPTKGHPGSRGHQHRHTRRWAGKRLRVMS